MRIVKILFSLMVVVLGFFAAFCLVVLGLFTRLFGGRAPLPAANVRFERTFRRTPPRPSSPAADVIDIEATPIKE